MHGLKRVVAVAVVCLCAARNAAFRGVTLAVQDVTPCDRLLSHPRLAFGMCLQRTLGSTCGEHTAKFLEAVRPCVCTFSVDMMTVNT